MKITRKVVLVELFTPQGCSSCPAADAFVAELPRLGFQRDRVVPLTFHVDYWDDLGWRDPFASSSFTARQRRYAGLGRLASPNGSRAPSGVYTPQMIVDGMVHFSGSQSDIALREISRAGAVAPTFSIAAHTTTVRDQAQIDVPATLPSCLPPTAKTSKRGLRRGFTNPGSVRPR